PALHVLGAVVALGQAPAGAVRRRRQDPAVGDPGRLLGVGALLVVGDGIGAVEARPGQALLVAELVAVAEGQVVLGRDPPLAAALDHEILRARRCCRSMLSKSARKLPAPNPFEPLRWMISKKKGPASGSRYRPAASLRKIC